MKTLILTYPQKKRASTKLALALSEADAASVLLGGSFYR